MGFRLIPKEPIGDLETRVTLNGVKVVILRCYSKMHLLYSQLRQPG